MEHLWNERIFDSVTGEKLEKLNAAFEHGELADFEPQPNDILKMTEDEIIEHAHATRDAFFENI